MTEPTLHIVFTGFISELRDALWQLRRNDRIVAFYDDFSLGPINPPDPKLRARWAAEELGFSDWEEIADDELAWNEALSDGYRRVAWLSRRSTQEYTGFLEFIWRLGDLPCEVVDLTDLMVTWRDEQGERTPPRLAECIGHLHAYQIVEHKLWERAELVTREERDAHRAAWQRLRTENAAFRILDGNLELTSASIAYFDHDLLSHATPEWQKAYRLVGESMVGLSENECHQVSGLVLEARLKTMAERGMLEARGDFSDHISAEVRLPISGRRATLNARSFKR